MSPNGEMQQWVISSMKWFCCEFAQVHCRIEQRLCLHFSPGVVSARDLPKPVIQCGKSSIRLYQIPGRFGEFWLWLRGNAKQSGYCIFCCLRDWNICIQAGKWCRHGKIWLPYIPVFILLSIEMFYGGNMLGFLGIVFIWSCGMSWARRAF